MKRAALILLLLSAMVPGLRAADDQTAPDSGAAAAASSTPADASASAGGISISPDSGAIAAGDTFTISFPAPMVTPDRIDMGGQPCPIVASPAVDGTFLWKSQTEGELTVNTVVAGAMHHFILAPGLKDAGGHRFSVPGWSADYQAEPFTLSTDYGFRKQLSAQPRVPLVSTYDVKLAEVAQHAWIQDRDSRVHFPIEVIQTTDGPPEDTEFQVSPRDPLPAGHTYDLVIEGLLDSKSRQPLPYPAVFPLGDTQPLKIVWAGGFNPALDVPTIRIKFNDTIDPDALKEGMIRISPDVPNLSITADEDEVDITGDFDLTRRYHITVSPDLVGERGYGIAPGILPKLLPQFFGRWAVSFPPRQPCISFPGPRIFLRSSPQLNFAFVQSHTPAVTWKLAKIPLEKLPAVTQRLTEYLDSDLDPLTGNTIPDPKTGNDREKQTELLVDALKLPVLLTGSCPAADTTQDEQRNITAALPGGKPVSGPYLIEASSMLPDGRIAGGRALVFFSDYILTQKRSPTQVFMRVAGMSDALPVSGITVRAVRDDNIELARAVTDSRGIAVFQNATLFPAKQRPVTIFIADTAGGPSLTFADDAAYSVPDDTAPARVSNHCLLITDRNLYRPGEEVKMKGILRDETSSGLALPPAGTVHWQIFQGDADKAIGEGTCPLSAEGAFEASWPIPASAALGECTLKCTLNDNACNGTSTFDIEEYRVPLFTVSVATATETGTAAHMQVSSVFFHGGANSAARVHWKAEWNAPAETGSDTMRYNQYREIGPVLDAANTPTQTIEGDLRLDDNGMATIACDAPFKTNPAVSISDIQWHADITSIDGQTLSGGASQVFSSTPVILGIGAEEKMTAPRGISVALEAVDPDGNPVASPVKVTADLYHVDTRTVKEQVAPLVFRYRNNDEFTKVDSRESSAPGSLVFSATNTGRYVIAVHGDGTPIVANETTVTGDEPAELPVENDTSFGLATRKEPWQVGDTAVFTVQASHPGVAWVCIETDTILDTMLVPLAGNAGRIEIPVKKEYAPNATVSIYLTRPGGPSALPVEQFAVAPLNVVRADRVLVLTPHLDRAEARPGQSIHGEISATSEDKPVAGADLAVFAVDDAVLQLGGWTLPDALATFYPPNPYSITNYQSLTDFLQMGTTNGNFQKGFIIGDGGEDENANASLRKEFRTLAFWNASLKTGADGKVSFDFEAPDNLTTYRLVTIGQTGDSRFGGDASQTVKITKPLLIDPALPRFVRNGDEVELRAVVRQSFADSAAVTASCVSGSGCPLTDGSAVSGAAETSSSCSLTGTAARNAPWVLRFRAKINDPDLAPIKIRFQAAADSDPAMSDAVEVTIPVSAPTVVRHESVAGAFTGPAFDAPGSMPKDWTQGRGQYALTVSTASWLPAIAGIPTILEYPHGCFEQITSKLLCYSLLASLMDYLPGTEARMAEYNRIFQEGIQQIGTSLLSDGRLPYWPGDNEGDDYVTCQGCWALNEAANDGFSIPDGLADKLSAATKTIATGSSDPDTRAFALFVLASLKSDDTDYPSIAEDVYLHRETMGFDGRALLAMALHQLNIMADEKLQLLREIDRTIEPTAFKPATFGSMDRTEGICAMAFETIAPPNFTVAKKQEIRKRLLHILDSGSALSAGNDTLGMTSGNGASYTAVTQEFSTQENLWLILALKSLLDAQPPPPLAAAHPAPASVSKNASSSAWTSGTANSELSAPFAIAGLNQSALTFLMQADFSLPQLDVPRVDRGFRVERVVHDLTNAARAGTPEAPYHIGDQVLVTYRVFTQKQQYYVALEDSLPAAFETVNPNLAQVGKFFDLPPPAPGDVLLDLSHCEIRDRTNLLYFNNIPPGPGVYSVLARVTAAGTFRWPQTQITPMYDSRFSGLSASSVCVVSAQ